MTSQFVYLAHVEFSLTINVARFARIRKSDFFCPQCNVFEIRNYHLAVARMFICGSKRVCRVEQKATLPSFLVVLAGMYVVGSSG